MAKKKSTKKSVNKKTIKPENVIHVSKLTEKLDKIQEKIDSKKNGNKNDKIVADLLEAKAAKYWGKQKEKLEAEE